MVPSKWQALTPFQDCVARDFNSYSLCFSPWNMPKCFVISENPVKCIIGRRWGVTRAKICYFHMNALGSQPWWEMKCVEKYRVNKEGFSEMMSLSSLAPARDGCRSVSIPPPHPQAVGRWEWLLPRGRVLMGKNSWLFTKFPLRIKREEEGVSLAAREFTSATSADYKMLRQNRIPSAHWRRGEDA